MFFSSVKKYPIAPTFVKGNFIIKSKNKIRKQSTLKKKKFLVHKFGLPVLALKTITTLQTHAYENLEKMSIFHH